MADVLNVQRREAAGKRRARRLRRDGAIPAVLYGHGEANVALAVPAAEVAAALRHGSRLVDLRGDLNEKAFIRELQWDTYGSEVLHVDLTRVSEHERVRVEVPIELRGEAPGAKEGGIVEHVLHEVLVDCDVSAIPEKLQMNINGLNKGEALNVSDLQVPAGVEILVDPETMVVHCVEPGPEAEVPPTTETAEPEVISRRAEVAEEESE